MSSMGIFFSVVLVLASGLLAATMDIVWKVDHRGPYWSLGVLTGCLGAVLVFLL